MLSRRFLLTLAAALAVLGPLASFGLRPAPTSAAQRRVVQCSGRIVAWRIDSDGTIYVQMQRSGDGEGDPELEPASRTEAVDVVAPQSRRVWFQTPPNLTTATRFEDLLLRVMLEAQGSKSAGGRVLTLLGEVEDEADGLEWSSGYLILAISQR